MAKKGGKAKIRKGKRRSDDSDSEEEETTTIEEQLEQTTIHSSDDDQKQQQQATTTTTEPSSSTTLSSTAEAAPIRTDIVYCKVCSLPIEYCEFHDKWVECEKWLAEFHPSMRDQLVELRENDKNKNKKIKKKKIEDEANKKQEPVVVTTSSRNKRKHATLITGVEHYGVSHKDASKFFAKKLSSGASVVKKPVIGIEIQGDVHIEVIELLQSQFNIPKQVIKFVEEKKKKKGAATAAANEADDSDDDE